MNVPESSRPLPPLRLYLEFINRDFFGSHRKSGFNSTHLRIKRTWGKVRIICRVACRKEVATFQFVKRGVPLRDSHVCRQWESLLWYGGCCSSGERSPYSLRKDAGPPSANCHAIYVTRNPYIMTTLGYSLPKKTTLQSTKINVSKDTAMNYACVNRNANPRRQLLADLSRGPFFAPSRKPREVTVQMSTTSCQQPRSTAGF